MITSSKFIPPKVEPWAITPSGEIVRMVIHREKLNPRQERFVSEYLKDGNGTQAAIRAGYATSSAAVHAHRLLHNKRVLDKVRAHQNRVQRATEVTVERVVRELEAVAFSDPLYLFDRKSNLLPFDKIPKEARRAIKLLEVQESVKGGRRIRTLKKVVLEDRIPAVIALAKYLGMFPKPLRGGRQPAPI